MCIKGRSVNRLLAVMSSEKNLVDFERIIPSPDWMESRDEDTRERGMYWMHENWGSVDYASNSRIDGDFVRFTTKTPVLPIAKKVAELCGEEVTYLALDTEHAEGWTMYVVSPEGEVETY
jgi:hypothetical protein